MKPLEKGMKAPELTLRSAGGTMLSIRDALNQGPAVIVLLPSANRSDTLEIIDNFRDDYNEFKALRASIIIIIKATDDELLKLQAEHELQYPLFGTTDNSLFRKFGALEGLMTKKPKKYGCVVDREGTITMAFRSIDSNKFSRQAIYALRDQMGRSALKTPAGS